MIGGRSVAWLYVHLRAPIDPAPPSAELPRHAARSCASDEEDAKRRRKCRLSLPRTGVFQAPCRRESDPFLSGSRTASHPPGPPAKLGQPLHILVCQENRTTTTVRFGRVELPSIHRLYHPKAIAVPVYRAPVKGKQLACANAADTNQPHHCTVGFREFVKQKRRLFVARKNWY
jgi:hypothetical protein